MEREEEKGGENDLDFNLEIRVLNWWERGTRERDRKIEKREKRERDESNSAIPPPFRSSSFSPAFAFNEDRLHTTIFYSFLLLFFGRFAYEDL